MGRLAVIEVKLLSGFTVSTGIPELAKSELEMTSRVPPARFCHQQNQRFPSLQIA